MPILTCVLVCILLIYKLPNVFLLKNDSSAVTWKLFLINKWLHVVSVLKKVKLDIVQWERIEAKLNYACLKFTCLQIVIQNSCLKSLLHDFMNPILILMLYKQWLLKVKCGTTVEKLIEITAEPLMSDIIGFELSSKNAKKLFGIVVYTHIVMLYFVDFFWNGFIEIFSRISMELFLYCQRTCAYTWFQQDQIC